MEDSSDQNKLFVGGVSWETTEDDLRDHFAKYGTVLSSAIAKDRVTGSSRGFAFVSFSDGSAVDLALQDSHEIRGRTVRTNLLFLFFFFVFRFLTVSIIFFNFIMWVLILIFFMCGLVDKLGFY